MSEKNFDNGPQYGNEGDGDSNTPESGGGDDSSKKDTTEQPGGNSNDGKGPGPLDIGNPGGDGR